MDIIQSVLQVNEAPAIHDYFLPDATPPPRDEQKEALFAAAAILYGSKYGWQTAMASRLRVEPRTLRRWISGQDTINPTAWELVKLLVKVHPSEK